MSEKNQRGNDRISSINLISYICTNENNDIVETGMGRTLNVSESGIMLETHNQIDSHLTILLSIGLGEDLIDIKGKIVHAKTGENNMYNIGIQFIELDNHAKLQLGKFIEAFTSP